MKKSIKFLAVFALCLSVLANCLPVQAAAASSTTCTSCGKTAYYSGSQLMSKVYRYEHKTTDGDCTVYSEYYLDTYRCGCGSVTQISRTEWDVHSIASHN